MSKDMPKEQLEFQFPHRDCKALADFLFVNFKINFLTCCRDCHKEPDVYMRVISLDRNPSEKFNVCCKIAQELGCNNIGYDSHDS